MYEILCEILKMDLKKEKQMYYSKNSKMIISKTIVLNCCRAVSDGNVYALRGLDSIKSYYKKNKRIEFQISCKMINTNVYCTRNLIEDCHFIWIKLAYIHEWIEYDDKINDLNLSINDLKIENTEIKTKLLIKSKSNKIYEENTHNILYRFLADVLLQLIITSYSNKLSKIPLNLSIFIDLVNQSDSAILKNDEIINSILDIMENVGVTLQDLKKASEKSTQNNLEEKLVKSLKPFNKIQFIEDITIGQDTFKKEELNQVLEILFFIKNRGNIIAHPNIDLEESLKMISIPIMPIKFEIDYFYENFLKGKIETEIDKKFQNIYDVNLPILINDNEDDYYKVNNLNIKLKEEYNLFKNIKAHKNGVMGALNDKIKKIRDNVLSQINISNIKKKCNDKGYNPNNI